MRLAGTWQCELWGILRIQQCCDYMHLWLVHQGRIFSQAFGRRVWCLYSLRYHHARFSASGREDITDGWSTKAEFSVKNLDEECDACTLCGTTMRDFLHLDERTSSSNPFETHRHPQGVVHAWATSRNGALVGWATSRNGAIMCASVRVIQLYMYIFTRFKMTVFQDTSTRYHDIITLA